MKPRKKLEKLRKRQEEFDKTPTEARRRQHMMHRPGSTKK